MAVNFDHIGNGFPYDPRKAGRLDMLVLEMAEDRFPGKNIVIRNKHGFGVCGTQVPGATETITITEPQE